MVNLNWEYPQQTAKRQPDSLFHKLVKVNVRYKLKKEVQTKWSEGWSFGKFYHWRVFGKKKMCRVSLDKLDIKSW